MNNNNEFSAESTIKKIRDAIDKADGMIGFSPRHQLFIAKGMAELAYNLFPSHQREFLDLDCEICRKINNPRYF